MQGRWRAYPLIIVIGCLLFLPGLGWHGLWDVDEAHNAECAREMMVADNWIMPSFNFQLRTDKPALLYWCIGLCYHVFGVSELAARLPSALVSIGSLLLTYELGRRLFDARTGVWAAIILGSSFFFGVAAHAATPDALLIFWTLASFLVFWHGYRQGSSRWLLWLGCTTGFALLAKGLIGFALPVGIIGLFLIWQRQLKLLWTWRLPVGLALMALIAMPWYLQVGVDTKWEFWRGFFLKHHVERFQAPLEGHNGLFFYHPLVALATFGPWSIFLMLTVWFATGKRGRDDAIQTAGDGVASYRFLWCWVVAWFTFFSIAGTKLPNYVLPTFPALALLTARFLVRWHGGQISVARWWWTVAMGLLACIGIGSAVGLVYGGWRLWGGMWFLPSLAWLAPVGLALVVVAVACHRLVRRGERQRGMAWLLGGNVAFVAILAAFGPFLVDQSKASPFLAETALDNQVEREVRLGCFGYYQPSLVFYSQRKVEVLRTRDDAIDWLKSPTQVFLFLPVDEWHALEWIEQQKHSTMAIAWATDLYSGKAIVLVTNKTKWDNQVAAMP